jgi:hypothetical protein
MLQTKEGRTAIIRNFKIVEGYNKTKADAMRSIMAENGGNPPRDLIERIPERLKIDRDALAKEFKRSIPIGEGMDLNDSQIKSLPDKSVITTDKGERLMIMSGKRYLVKKDNSGNGYITFDGKKMPVPVKRVG